MTGRELLRQCRKELKEILILEQQRDYYMTLLLPRAIRYDNDKIQTTPEDYQLKMMAKAAALDDVIMKKLHALFEKHTEAHRRIDAIPDSYERQVLLLYYLSAHSFQRGGHVIRRLHTWETVSEVSGISARHAKRLHKRAIEYLS